MSGNYQMRKTLVIWVMVLFTSAQLPAQYMRGGFGYGFFGPVYNLSPTVQNDLKVPSLLGDGLQLNGLSILAGGGGYGLLNNNILIGGSGFSYKISDATQRGQANFSIGGGFVNFGYLHIAKNSMMAFPYFGIGACGMDLRIKNDTPDDIFVLGSVTIEPGENKNFNSAAIGLEMGYAIKLLAFSIDKYGSNGGFMVGLQIGTYFFSGIDNWHEKNTDDVIPVFSRPYVFSPYLRLTVGGGGFSQQ